MNTISPSTVRRSAALAAVALTAAAGLGVTASTADAASASSSASSARVIHYAHGKSVGVSVQNRAQAKRLYGAPADFKRFIGNKAQHLTDTSTCSGEGYVGVTVETLRTDGYATGGVNDCGGYQALWAKNARTGGRWKEIGGAQEAFGCRFLHRYTFPSSVVGTVCYDYAAKKQRVYHQA